MPLQKLQFRPGLNREGTDYSNEGGWYDGDKIRFRSGFPEKIGGWTQVSSAQFNGVCRSIWIWQDGDSGVGNQYIGLGTNTKYYIFFGGVYNDITPIYQTDTLTNPFTTALGSTTVTVTDGGHQPSIGDFVYFSGGSIVGGVFISGDYIVTDVLSSTQYTITATQTATSNATGGGTVTAQYEYPSGGAVYSVGGGWGAPPWGGISPAIAYALPINPFSISAGSNIVTVNQPNHGLTAGKYVAYSGVTTLTNPAVTYLFTTGAYTLTSGAYRLSGVVVDSLGANYLNGTFTVNSVIDANTYTIVVQKTAIANLSGGGGSVVAYEQSGSQGWGVGYSSGIGTQLRLWSNDNYGADLVIAPRGGPVFYWQDSGTVGTRAQYLSTIANQTTALTDNSTFTSSASSITVSGANAPYIYPYMVITGTNLPANTQVASSYITGATTVPITTVTTGTSSGTYSFSYAGAYVPSATYQVIASAIQEFIITFGSESYVPGNANQSFNPMLVRWSDQGNAYQWIPQLTNQAGEYLLTNGSFIMGARATRQEILVWTDSCLYSMQYLGSPYVWGFQILMDNISIMSPNSMITINNVTYWMGKDRFYMYSGRVEVLPCSLRQYIFDDINQDQAYQVFAGANEAFNEVWWYYCSGNSTVVDKYIIYNYLDRVWYYGTLGRTAWLQTGTQPYPIAADYNGRLLYHENGTNDNSTASTLPIACYVQSSDFDIGDGHNFGFVWRILPDVNFNGSTTNQPAVTMTIKPRQNSGTPYGQADSPQVKSAQNYTNVSQYTIQEFDGQVYTRLRGRQMSFRIESTGVGVAWQLGSPRIDIRPDGRR
jgi:hypothetical protein